MSIYSWFQPHQWKPTVTSNCSVPFWAPSDTGQVNIPDQWSLCSSDHVSSYLIIRESSGNLISGSKCINKKWKKSHWLINILSRIIKPIRKLAMTSMNCPFDFKGWRTKKASPFLKFCMNPYIWELKSVHLKTAENVVACLQIKWAWYFLPLSGERMFTCEMFMIYIKDLIYLGCRTISLS